MLPIQASRQQQDLPYEIWLLIASFLPWTTVQNLLSLNRPFFDYILSVRYRVVHIGDFTNPGSCIALERLLDPVPSCFVRSLTLRPARLLSVPAPASFSSSWSKESSPTKLRRFSQPRPPRTHGLAERNQTIPRDVLLAVMSNMTQVKTLTVECSEEELNASTWDPRFCEVLHTGWQAFTSTLETLVLNVPADLLGQLTRWTLPCQRFPHLQEIILQLTASEFEREGYNRIIDSSLSPFLNTNNHVHSLAVTVVSKYFNIARLFDGLSSFPSLSKLRVVFPSSDPVVATPISNAIHAFASTRTPNIQELSLELASTLLASTLCCQTTGRPRICPQKLRLCISDRIGLKTEGVFFPMLSASIEKMVPTLGELDLGNIILSPKQFKDIISLFRSSATLSALHLSVEELSPEVFLSTSDTLPDLKRFTIRYEFLNINVFSKLHWQRGHPPNKKIGVIRLPVAQFITATERHSFANWGLEHLRIQPLKYSPWISCTHAIAETFPNVKTFNGASREEYLSPSYMNHI